MGYVEDKTGIDVTPGGVVGDIGDWVVDEILDPVVNTVTGVVEGMLDNPVKTVAQIAAVATQQYWALPLIEGADVAAKGGDLDDVLKATAKAYVAQELGSAAGKYAYQGASTAAAGAAYGTSGQQAAMLAAQEASMRTAADIAGQIVGAGAASAGAGIVYGRDPVEALKLGIVSAGSSQLVGLALGELDKQTGGAFANLRQNSPTAAAAIESAITAQLTGQNVTAEVVSSAIRTSKIATNLVDQFAKDNPGISESQKALAAQVLTNVTATAFAGGDPSRALQATLMQVGSKALGDIAKTEFKSLLTNVENSYKEAQLRAQALDKNIAEQESIASQYNTLAGQLNAKIAEQDRLLNLANQAKAAFEGNKTQANADAANAAIRAYNTYADALTKEYNQTFKPQLDQFNNQLSSLQTEYDGLVQTYEEGLRQIQNATTPLEEKYKDLFSTTAQAFVQAMDPNFNPEEYKEINGLGTDVDAYEHWLNTGQFGGLKTNLESANFELTAEKSRLLTDLAAAKGVSVSQLNEKDVKNFYDKLDSSYGSNLGALKSANLTDIIKGNVTLDSLTTETNKSPPRISITGVAYGGWNEPPEGTFTLPEGIRYATDEEMETNKAVVVYSNKGAPVWVIPEDQTQWDPAKGDIQTLPTVVVSAPRLDDLQQTDPLAWLYTTQSLPEEVAKKTVGDYLYNFAKGTIDLANQTGNSTIINSAANALKAGGGILEAFNGLVTLVGKNPQDTSVGKFAKSLMDLGKASNTEEYKAALANMQSTWADAKGITGTAKAIWKNFTDYPTEFLAEIVGVEGMQEVVPLLIGGGAATAARGLALAKGMGTTLASQIGTRAGLTAAAASDIAESAGGAAANAFEDAYQTAIKTGKSESEATKIALDVAGRTALIAGTTTAVTLGIGGQALEKVILGNKGTGQLANVFDEIGNRIKTGGSIVVKEGVTEGIEEGLQQGYLEGQLYQLDPTRDVAKNIATSTILGAIAGGGVAGGAYAGYSTGDVVSNLLSSNPTISQTIGSATSAQDLSNKLSSLGIDDNIIKTNLLNTKYDTDYTSSLEAEKAFFNRPDFVASQQDIDALVGATPNSGLPAALEAYVDPRVVDRQEIIDAARAEGLTLTEEQIQKYIGQKDEASTLTGAKTEFDPLGTTQEEAAAIFKDVYGYTPSATELNQFVKDNFSEQQARTDIGAYVDPRQVTRQEVLDFFKSTGYTPTEQEITQYIKQGTDVNQDAIRELLNQYVDPRYVDYNEAADALKAAGITKPSPDDVYKLIGQYQETEAAGKVAADLDRLRFNSLQYQIGQISGAGLSEQFASFEERVAAEIARAEAAGLTRDQAINVALDRVAGDLNYTREQLINQLGTTEAAIRQDLQSGMLNLGTEIKSVAQRLQEQIAANEASGMSRDEALNAAINKVSGDLGTTKENLLTQLGTTEANLRQEFSTGISNIQKDFQTRVAELQAQGLSQFEATQQALNEVRLTQSQQFAMTQDQIKQVADFVGKPYRDVTQADIDFVNTIIGQQQAQPGTALTQQQLAYDANLDGRIDQADLNLLQGAISGTVDQPFVPGAGTIWTQQPTGVYGVLASQQAAAVERDRLQREQAAKLAQQGRQQANVNALQQMLMTAPDIAGQQVTVKAPDPAQIGYIYDWNSIFATPQQERMFITPYAQGGMVGSDDDVTAELMKILRS